MIHCSVNIWPVTHLHAKWLPQPLQQNPTVFPGGFMGGENDSPLGVRPVEMLIEHSERKRVRCLFDLQDLKSIGLIQATVWSQQPGRHLDLKVLPERRRHLALQSRWTSVARLSSKLCQTPCPPSHHLASPDWSSPPPSSLTRPSQHARSSPYYRFLSRTSVWDERRSESVRL